MTKQGSFKRAVRRLARETGQRYTEARAVLEKAGESPFARTRPFEHATLNAHLEAQYGIRVTSVVPIDDDPEFRPRGSWPGHYPWTLIVKHEDGLPWVARIFSSPADDVGRVAGDADVLRFLASHHFPTERIAHDEPVSVLNGDGVIVTEFIEGGRPTDADGRLRSPDVQYELASLLGRLHTLPPAGGALARPGGSEEHDGGFFAGKPKQDLVAAMSFLVSVEDAVAPEGRELFEYLRDHLEKADDAEGLPEAFTHGNYHAWSAVGTPGNLAIVGWAGSGRGPRLPALAWLLTTAAEAGPAYVDAVMRGYGEHVQLTDDELTRLPGVLNMRALWLACLDYRESVRSGITPTMNDARPGYGFFRPDHANQLAAQAITFLRS
ncbi:phosphotransferase enzyme family protein [Kribbella deserti]|uniref:Phosphotransferase enzyme family protein n=1 Tax=Kribbella deserti TaxID=1926257 RepID=A0ABV6QFJ5_9ACTN